MRLNRESRALVWFVLPFVALTSIYLIFAWVLSPAPGTIVDQGQGYEGVQKKKRISYNFNEGYQQVDQALTELFASHGLEPGQISRVERTATYTQPLKDTESRSWFRSRAPKEITWPYKELTVVTPVTESGLVVFDYQRMLESKLWSFGARVITEEVREVNPTAENLDKLGLQMAQLDTRKAIGLVVEIGYSARIDGQQITVITHKVTLVQPWVEAYTQRYPGRIKPKIALVIDDWGYDYPQAVQTMLDLPVKLNMAVIPGLDKSWDQALLGFSRGWEVMLHLPMEPENANWRLGEYAIRTEMSETQIRETVRKALAVVPAVSGVNNHMGSKATADPRVMQIVLDEVIRRTNLFFIDSHTTGRSAVPEVAEEMGLPYGENLVFIDNEDDPEYILKRLQLLVEVAKRKGEALGIGHLRVNTARALEHFVRSREFQEVELVFASELVSNLSLKESGSRN